MARRTKKIHRRKPPDSSPAPNMSKKQPKSDGEANGTVETARMTSRQGECRTASIEKYDIILSKKRLEERGFHPAVTSKPKDEVLADWAETVRKYTIQARPAVVQPRKLTRALLVLRHDVIQSRPYTDGETTSCDNKLAFILNATDIGGQIAQHIFADGYSVVRNAALTSTQAWSALMLSVKVWDFFAGDFYVDGPGRVFHVVAPEYTIEDFQRGQTWDPYKFRGENFQGSWVAKAKSLETKIFDSIGNLHRRLGKQRKGQPSLAPVTEELIAYTRHLKDIENVGLSNQFKSGLPGQIFDPSAKFAVTRLQLMMKKISEQRSRIKVLYFQKTPYLDRRIIAIILRACPQLEMVGIYNCPLIHFGDILCLLDLIHEINREKRERNLPSINALDFFPRFHEGSPFQHLQAPVYGLTWGPQKLDIVQRGFFCIVLKAFMKAQKMKLGLLFSEGNAFCDFLFKVPNYSLAAHSFLDAMYRLVDLQRKKKQNHNEHKQLVYDLLKPVRIGLERDISLDWPHWYTGIMGKHLVFCSSCGYEMLEEFFTADSRHSRPHLRICAGCMLQFKLDNEGEHLKTKKMAIITTLFPEWNGKAFNQDAPLAAAARRIINLKTTVSEPVAPPGLVLNDDGAVVQPPYERVLVRDNKIHFDSLQNLPSLEDLVEDSTSAKLWRTVSDQSKNLDMYSRLTRDVRVNPRVLPGHRLSHSFSNLVDLETMVYSNGWL